eukprot:CAMPEP_0197664970 /NCGR_PEP_ID=MMETSP1338-20131121/58957_1 /TAXON_ID=43686 ORGANISM="Pelagodinium beii, Strain RCC1491" /NCGR_SAMPLE_ID=MMETSP1338 /ASSEMBLY_ACC=CAM_ASM_000754 /LENGTH=703 /DNA_ID=CAMNT_0043243711 /DNA_START=36 /DNA_END=2144 /DNA_ORIENTATION=-
MPLRRDEVKPVNLAALEAHEEDVLDGVGELNSSTTGLRSLKASVSNLVPLIGGGHRSARGAAAEATGSVKSWFSARKRRPSKESLDSGRTAADAGASAEEVSITSSILKGIYGQALTDAQNLGVLTICPEIGWLVECYCRTPLPPSWRKSKVADDDVPVYADENAGETFEEMPCLRQYTRLAEMVLRARQNPEEAETAAAWVRHQMRVQRLEMQRLQAEWTGPHVDPDTQSTYFHNPTTSVSVWENPCNSVMFQVCVAEKLLTADAFPKLSDSPKQPDVEPLRNVKSKGVAQALAVQAPAQKVEEKVSKDNEDPWAALDELAALDVPTASSGSWNMDEFLASQPKQQKTAMAVPPAVKAAPKASAAAQVPSSLHPFPKASSNGKEAIAVPPALSHELSCAGNKTSGGYAAPATTAPLPLAPEQAPAPEQANACGMEPQAPVIIQSQAPESTLTSAPTPAKSSTAPKAASLKPLPAAPRPSVTTSSPAQLPSAPEPAPVPSAPKAAPAAPKPAAASLAASAPCPEPATKAPLAAPTASATPAPTPPQPAPSAPLQAEHAPASAFSEAVQPPEALATQPASELADSKEIVSRSADDMLSWAGDAAPVETTANSEKLDEEPVADDMEDWAEDRRVAADRQARQLSKLADRLRKLAEEPSQDCAAVCEVLEALESAPVTVASLKATQLGLLTQTLKDSPNSEIRTAV